jgi:hypothetical protein
VLTTHPSWKPCVRDLSVNLDFDAASDLFKTLNVLFRDERVDLSTYNSTKYVKMRKSYSVLQHSTF